MKRKYFAMLFVLIFCIASCVTQRETLDSWLYHTKGELIMSWGPPSRVFSDPSVGEIFTYAKQFYLPPLAGTYNTGQVWWDYTMFYINSEGKIYSWRTARYAEPPQQINVNVIIRGY